MSQESEPYIAYGVVVKPAHLAKHFGAQYFGSGTPEEWAEQLAQDYWLDVTQAGNAWMGVELYIIGPKSVRDPLSASITCAAADIQSVQRLSSKLGLPLDWHLGVWVY